MLNLDVSTEEFLSTVHRAAFTYTDLYTMLANENTVLWLTPHAAVMRESGRGILDFKVDGKDIDAWDRSPEHLSEICDVVLRLLAASAVHSVHLHNWGRQDVALINTASLAFLMEQSQSLETLTLVSLELDESHCRILGVHSRPDLEILLSECELKGAAAEALAEVLGSNQGPTELHSYAIDNMVFANGLRGNSRLKSLTPYSSGSREFDNRQVLAIASALRENEGLVDLDLNSCWMSDETWGAVCDSLKTHPTLEVLDLSSVYSAGMMTPAVIAYRIHATAAVATFSTNSVATAATSDAAAAAVDATDTVNGAAASTAGASVIADVTASTASQTRKTCP
jgi:hypothetical protein